MLRTSDLGFRAWGLGVMVEGDIQFPLLFSCSFPS